MARHFDATGERVNFGDVSAVDGLTAFAVGAWIKVDDVTRDNTAVAKIGTLTSVGGWILFFDDSNPSGNDRMDFFIDAAIGNAGGYARVSSSDEVPVDEWHHWMGVYDGAADEMRLYKNGVLNSTATSITNEPASTTENLLVGDENFSGDRQMFGSLAEVMILNYVPTVGEVSSIAWRSRPFQRPVFYAPLGYGSPEPEYSGDGVTGTVTGATVADHAPVLPPFGLGQPYSRLVTSAAGGGGAPRHLLTLGVAA